MTVPITSPPAPRPPSGRADAPGRERGPARVLLGWRQVPPWGQALLVYLASRVLFMSVVERAAYVSPPHPGGRHWNYLEIANAWDGTWYERIVIQGYPAVLPRDGAGVVEENTWAFYPLFPRLVGGLMRLTGLEWTLVATVVSLVSAAVAVVVLRGVLARVVGPRTAMWGIALLCFFPTAPVFQLPYSESLALLLVAVAFWALQRERYWLLVPVLLVIGVARPVGVPLAVVLGVHFLRQLWAVRGLPRTAWWSLAGPFVACVAAGVAAVEWPLIAWHGTGVRDAYTQTMAAWRSPHEVVPVRPWIHISQNLAGTVTGPVLLAALLAAYGWWLVRRGLPVIGPDLTTWCAAYVAYLVAVLDSFTSLPRYLVMLFPLGVLLASTSSSRVFRATVTAGFAIGGVVWLLVIWRSRCYSP